MHSTKPYTSFLFFVPFSLFSLDTLHILPYSSSMNWSGFSQRLVCWVNKEDRNWSWSPVQPVWRIHPLSLRQALRASPGDDLVSSSSFTLLRINAGDSLKTLHLSDLMRSWAVSSHNPRPPCLGLHSSPKSHRNTTNHAPPTTHSTYITPFPNKKNNLYKNSIAHHPLLLLNSTPINDAII